MRTIMMIAFSCLFLNACPGQPGNQKEDGTWRILFSDSFDRSDGPLANESWHVINTNGLATNIVILNSEVAFNRSNSSVFPFAIYTNSLNYSEMKISIKFRTPADGTETAIILSAHCNDFNDLLGYSLVFGIGTKLLISTNGNRQPASELDIPLTGSTTYNMQLHIKGHSVSGTLYSSSMSVLTNIYYNDASGRYSSGSISLAGGVGTIADDFKIEYYQ